MTTSARKVENNDVNREPITGALNAHPIGTGLGAAGGGAAGAAIGTAVAGPVGSVVGAAIGAAIGGVAAGGMSDEDSGEKAISPVDDEWLR